jgi:hypothetical protein
MRAVKRTRKAALLGLGLDAQDGQTRITKGDNYLLYGGSQDTHAVMQETAVKINEQLDRRGQRLDDVSVKELRGIARDVVKGIVGEERSDAGEE